MTPLRPAVVLFDLDGTLSNSAPGILASLRAAFAENGLPPLTPEVELGLLGPPFYESIPPLIGGAAKLPPVLAAYRLHYGAGAMYDTTLYEGMRDVLDLLRERGTRLAVATSKPEPHAIPIVAHLGLTEYFETVGGDDFDGSLPTKALVVERVLERMGRPDPASVVMVGDRLHDVVGARENGVAAVGAGWGYAPPGELEAAEPTALCATPADLHALLSRP